MQNSQSYTINLTLHINIPAAKGESKEPEVIVKTEQAAPVKSNVIEHTNDEVLKDYFTISQIARDLDKTPQAAYLFVKRRGCLMIRLDDLLVVHRDELYKLK